MRRGLRMENGVLFKLTIQKVRRGLRMVNYVLFILTSQKVRKGLRMGMVFFSY